MERSLLLIKELFEFHEPSELAIKDMGTVRLACAQLAKDVLDACGPSAHTTVAIRSIHQAMMDIDIAIVNGRHNNVLAPDEIKE